MGTQVDLGLAPMDVMAGLSGMSGVFALDGGGAGSWACGRALIGARPRSRLCVYGDGSAVLREGESTTRLSGDPFDLLEAFRAETRRATEPYAGGVLAALSYDLRRWVEPRRVWRSAPGIVLYAARYDELLSYDYSTRGYTWGTVPGAGGAAGIGELAACLSEPRPAVGEPAPRRVHTLCSRDEYITSVRAALAYVGAGDIYQVNLSQCFVAAGGVSPLALYAAMQRRHPMPFSAYVDCRDFVLVSNSPECFLLRDGGVLSTYPIKGTRARSRDASADRRQAHELRNDPKELAEHVMIVDLERNDLGRVCDVGSVRVDTFARVESFPTLHHMVSTVRGHIADEVTSSQILRATFPGGSITGAPKVRAMQIIDELEPVERGFYTGSIGFLDDCGRATFNIAIRTAVVTPEGATYHAGGGIVADSDPDREYEETLLKAQPFLSALHAKAA